MQGVAPSDTVPLYYASKTEIPQGGSKTWYESLTISLDNTEATQPETVVSLVKANYIRGAQPCSPPAGNIQTKPGRGGVTLEPNSPKAISAKPFYFTSGATFSLNFTLTSPSSATLLIYILDSIEEYNCLRAKTCSPHNPKSFNLSIGNQDSFSEPFSISSYYFVVLSSSENENITLTYSYEATSHYYNHTDYSDKIQSTCTLNFAQGKTCTLNIIGNFDECALAYTVPDESVDFVSLKVVAHHRRFNYLSIVFLALFVASSTLVIACLVSVLVARCFQRRSGKSGYSKLM